MFYISGGGNMKYKPFGKRKFKKGYEAQHGEFYGVECFDYAIRWAELLEKDISFGRKNGIPIRDVIGNMADQRSHEADTKGITGFMYGVSVLILSQTWKYGKELAEWHNALFGYKGDGVVNPAVFTIK